MQHLNYLLVQVPSVKSFFTYRLQFLNEIPSLPHFPLVVFFYTPNAILPLNQNHLLFGRKRTTRPKTDSQQGQASPQS